MRMHFAPVAVAAATLSVGLLANGAGASAETPDKKPEPCLFANQISGWSYIDDKTVGVRAGSKRFQLVFFANCRQAKWAHSTRVDNMSLCLRPGDTMIFSSTDGFHERCTIDKISLLPPDWKPPSKDAPAPQPAEKPEG